MQLHSTYYPHHRHLLSFLSLLLSLALTFVACSGPGSSNNSTATATTSTGNGSNSTATVSTSPTAQVHLGPQPCPNAVKDPAHWDAIVGTQNGVSKVGRVTCANLVGQSSLQTLILVGYQGTGLIVDIYVYDHITDPHPTQLFKLQGLYKGDARISGYNTVLTAEVDSDSSINKDKSNAALTLDLFREFKWSDGADTFVPVAFPGIFPDLTRYQAEVAQAAANQGHEPWRLSATMTAQALAANSKLLKWSNTSATIISGGGDHDPTAVISLKNSHPAGGSIIVTQRGQANGPNEHLSPFHCRPPILTPSLLLQLSL